MSEIRLNWTIQQPVIAGYSSVRLNLTFAQPLNGGYSVIRSNYQQAQPLVGGYSTIRVCEIFCQALFPVQPELPMSTTPFPGFGNSTTTPSIPAAKDPAKTALPGITYSVHKKPYFKTRVVESAAGGEVRTSFMEYPRWDFEFSYEFLEDRSGAESSLKTIMGFFLQMRGSFDTFLLKDPDDYLVEYGLCGTSDGATTQFPFTRTLGGFAEKVNQVDTANTIAVYHQIDEAGTIPAMAPYEITTVHSAAFHRDAGVLKGTTPMTKVTGAPAAGQYSVSAGVYTFNAADAGAAVTITYGYEVSDLLYSVRQPNFILFDSAPSAGEIYADFQFFFACRFLDDQQDFEKFMDQLWSMQTCNFRSVIQ